MTNTIDTNTIEVTRDTIVGLSGHPLSGLWQLILEHGIVLISSGCGVRSLATAFGCEEFTDDIQTKISGQTIIYSTDCFGEIEGFTPIDEWQYDIPEHDGDTITIEL